MGRIRSVGDLLQILRADMKRMKNNKIVLMVFSLTLTLTLIADAYCGERKPVKPSPKDKCPVCGMFVAKYPKFLAQILFKDRSSPFFDGTKDLLKWTCLLLTWDGRRLCAEGLEPLRSVL